MAVLRILRRSADLRGREISGIGRLCGRLARGEIGGIYKVTESGTDSADLRNFSWF